MQSIRTTTRPAGRLAAALVLALSFAVAAPASAASSLAAQHHDPASDCALTGTTGWTDEGHNTDYTQFQRPSGHIKVAMLFVDFPDAPATDDTSGYYRFLAPAAQYMSDFSYGKVHLDITPINHWLRMPQDSATYGFQRGITWDQQALYIKQAGEAAAPYTDLSKFDMIYVVPTKNASAITFSPAYLYDPTHPNLVVNGKEIKWGVTLGQDMYHWGPKVADHETGHTFGLPDLYAFGGTDIHRFVGGFDLMGNIAGDAPHHFGWEDWKNGWIGDGQVSCLNSPGTMTTSLRALEIPGGKKIAVVRTGTTTAYVVESRRALGVDGAICKSGAVVYKVDSSTPTGTGPIQVQDSSPGAPTTATCKEAVDFGVFTTGQTFTDTAAGVTIKVDTSTPLGDTVTVTKA